MNRPALEVEKLSIALRNRVLLQCVRLLVPEGGCIGITGPSGVGKSIFARAISGLAVDSEGVAFTGTVRVGGIEILPDRTRAREVRGREVVLIPQSAFLSMPPYLTVGGLASAILWTSHRKETVRRLAEIMQRFGIDDPERLIRSRPAQLSGGERQRALMSIALLKEPRLLVADEPTTALDPRNKALVIDALKAAQESIGFALVLISHDLPLLSRLAARIVKFEDNNAVDWSLPTEDVQSRASVVLQHSSADADRGDSILTASSVSVSLAGRSVLSEIQLELGRYDRLAVLGASGSGKTTLAKVVTGLIRPSLGAVESRVERADWRPLNGPSRRIQMIYQDPVSSFDPRLTLFHSVSLAAFGSRRVSSEQRKRIESLAQRLGIRAGALARRPPEVSGGECQRAALLRAFLCRPAILVADEFTSNLDPESAAGVQALIEGAIDRNELALVLVSHDFDLVRRLCNRALVLENGEIVERGPTEQVLDAPTSNAARSLTAGWRNQRARP